MISAGLFGRVVEVELGVAGAPGRRIRDLRIAFRCKHSDTSESNTATVQVWNVAPETVALAQREGATLRVLAGYETTTVRQVFEGDILPGGVRVRRQGADRVLELEAADGLRGLQRTVTISAVRGVTVEALLGQVLAQTGWARGVISIDTSATLPQGVTHVGPPGPVLDRITRATGGAWYVRDGALYVTPAGAPVPEEAPEFSSVAGNLVGTPQPTDDGVEVTVLLDAGMRPGRRFVVASSSINGTFVATDVAFVGDNGWDKAFYATIVGVPE